jgi:periplasmic mercuric ion binding protein
MKKPMAATLALLGALAYTDPVAAAERTVTLTVENMDCAACGPMVRQALMRVDGVARVSVLVSQQIATVPFDDEHTNVPALVQATTNLGYPSRLAR